MPVAIASGGGSRGSDNAFAGCAQAKASRQAYESPTRSRSPQSLAKLHLYTEQNARRSLVTQNAVRVALLTWVRTKEIRFAKRSEFEGLGTANALWRIPAERMKLKREHIVPLSWQAEQLVSEMLLAGNGPYVFPGNKLSSPLSESTMIYALYRMGYIGRQTVHGFRGLASTWANEQLTEFGDPTIWVRKYHEDWIETQLAHADENEVRSSYNAAEYLAPRRRMMQDWADFIELQTTLGMSTMDSGEIRNLSASPKAT